MRKEATSPSIVGHALGMTKEGADQTRRENKAWETGGSPWWIWNQQRECLSGDTEWTQEWVWLSPGHCYCVQDTFTRSGGIDGTPRIFAEPMKMDRCWDVKSDIIPNSECRYSPVVLFCFVIWSGMQDLSSQLRIEPVPPCWCLLLGKWVLSTELPEKYLLSCLDSRESRI